MISKIVNQQQVYHMLKTYAKKYKIKLMTKEACEIFNECHLKYKYKTLSKLRDEIYNYESMHPEIKNGYYYFNFNNSLETEI